MEQVGNAGLGNYFLAHYTRIGSKKFEFSGTITRFFQYFLHPVTWYEACYNFFCYYFPGDT